MRITRVEAHHVDKFLLIEVHTDAGISGVGESGAVGVLEASAAAVEMCERYLIGKDPLTIEHHHQYMYRCRHVRGAALMGALSGIDIALWDIAGKHYGVPVHRLLGGPTRDRVRVYHHVMGDTRAKLLQGIQTAREKGFTAVGHLTPWLDTPREQRYETHTHVQRISDAVDAVGQYRETVGTAVDLCVEIHRRLTPAEAVVLGRAIEPFFPFFVEDPVLPDNLDEMAYVAAKLTVPIATGERLITIWEFQMLLARNAVSYVRPNVCLVGGLTGAKKIAALAEAHHVGVVPHNPLSPVSTAACLQLAAAVPNVPLLEYCGDEDVPPKSVLVDKPAENDGAGYLLVPTKPGIGITLNRAAVEAIPPRRREFITRLHYDGSVVDQ